jgi:hypothetical protein
VVFTSVSDACFKCFICLQKHVANVSSICFKSRSGAVVGDPHATATGVPLSGRRRAGEGSRGGATRGVRAVLATFGQCGPAWKCKIECRLGRLDVFARSNVQTLTLPNED